MSLCYVLSEFMLRFAPEHWVNKGWPSHDLEEEQLRTDIAIQSK
jgi:hypothetical protein